jgi:hypothetical protein
LAKLNKIAEIIGVAAAQAEVSFPRFRNGPYSVQLWEDLDTLIIVRCLIMPALSASRTGLGEVRAGGW